MRTIEDMTLNICLLEQQFCISVTGMKLWNAQKRELKSGVAMFQFKKLFKREKIRNYELDG